MAWLEASNLSCLSLSKGVCVVRGRLPPCGQSPLRLEQCLLGPLKVKACNLDGVSFSELSRMFRPDLCKMGSLLCGLSVSPRLFQMLGIPWPLRTSSDSYCAHLSHISLSKLQVTVLLSRPWLARSDKYCRGTLRHGVVL